jgi:hypothetical protein
MKNKLIKAKALQRSPWFIDLLNEGQHRYREFFDAKRNTTALSDSEILSEYIHMNDVVFGVFKDNQYELGWGTYIIKGKTSLTSIITEQRTKALKTKLASLTVVNWKRLSPCPKFSVTLNGRIKLCLWALPLWSPWTSGQRTISMENDYEMGSNRLQKPACNRRN